CGEGSLLHLLGPAVAPLSLPRHSEGLRADSLWRGLAGELPAHTCTVYRPWFSPYSYFMCTKGAAQKQLGSLSSILASSTQEHEEPDDLSEIICSSSGSSDELQPTERDRPARNRASITFRDILAASQWQPVPQRGYQCVSCCRVFPTLWSVKDHIQHSSQEGYSCKVYYRKLKALWEKEHKDCRGRALLHRSCQRQNKLV
uniref:Spermatogenesis associated 46 n=1 Tax=Buteo japonicus TaxID=224669 RepID=A0A8C0HQQ8_9AVES